MKNTFGFLFTSNKLRPLDDNNLMSYCDPLEAALKSGENSDIDGKELFMELKILQGFLPQEEMMGPLLF